MNEQTSANLRVAGDLIVAAMQTILRPTTPIIPEYYRPLGGLVVVTRATREFLDKLPRLTEFDPDDYYDSEGTQPVSTSIEQAEFALNDAHLNLHSAHQLLDEAWAHIGRIGLKTTDD